MGSVVADLDFQRIAALPRRQWTPEQVEQLVAYYTDAFRMPSGKQRLFPAQALVIHEAITCGGILGPIEVGNGKTLPSMLLATALGAKTPLLLVPAGLLRKTRKEKSEIGIHWRLPRNQAELSYEMLGRDDHRDDLERIYKPDLIICDEAHKLKNQKAAVTRRVMRYVQAHPECRVVLMSGTLMGQDLGDYAHLALLALRERSPLPITSSTLFAWKSALRDRDSFGSLAMDPGPLLSWPYDGEPDCDVEQARMAVRKRVLETPGVVNAPSQDGCGASLNLRPLRFPAPPVVEPMFRRLREEWTTPDGWALGTPSELWMRARELALGFHYIWNPRPPEYWLEARRAWAACVREYFESNDDLDTEYQLRLRVQRGQAPAYEPALRAWLNVEPTFRRQVEAVWHSREALEQCAAWASKTPGVVWTDHSLFAKELSRVTGMAYYGQQAEDASGRSIADVTGRESIIASVQACGEGQNLQMYSRALVVSPRSGSRWEQLLGRHHRKGQKADEVTYDIGLACRENLEAIPRARQLAKKIHQELGQRQKMLIASIDWPDAAPGKGWPWARNKGRSPTQSADMLIQELTRLDRVAEAEAESLGV